MLGRNLEYVATLLAARVRIAANKYVDHRHNCTEARRPIVPLLVGDPAPVSPNTWFFGLSRAYPSISVFYFFSV